MNSLEGTRILMFYPYGATKHYGDSIKEELINRGAFVLAYDERPSQNSFVKMIIRLLKKRVPVIFKTYIKKIIKQNRNVDFDHILVLRGEAFTKETINTLKSAYKKAKLILYLWDILKTTKLQDVLPFFDKVLSFDPDDVECNKGVIFRPTFFMPQYETLRKKESIKNDIVFIGTLHSNRYKVLKKMRQYFINNEIRFFSYLYVPGKIAFIKNKFIDKIPIKKKDIHFTPISLDETLDIISETTCILDLNYTGQKSLSMRAFEAMASKTKYITTNPEIKKYNFYNASNILVIDINKSDTPKEFLGSPFIDIPAPILNQYSVQQLVDDIFFSANKKQTFYFKETESGN